jgi:2,4-dienoyl-CoA reductase-like NADH-dependent reductase (Old Yellow Enzyme family)/thioredoxin reductase
LEEAKMAAPFEKLFEPGQIAKVRIKNRVVASPLANSFCTINGELTQRAIDHYVARAKGGAGLIRVSVDLIDYPRGSSIIGPRLDAYNKTFLHYNMVQTMHAYGAKVSYQVAHTGRQIRMPRGVELVSCSSEPCVFVGEYPLPQPRPLDEDEIYLIVEEFAKRALYAKMANYDFVEIHGAHGYLVTSFMSPRWNTRTDKWGGTLENRMRFPVEIIRRMKEMAGEAFPIGIRISADEFIEGGITTKESPIMAKMLEEAGVAYIDASTSCYEEQHKSNDIARLPEGWKRSVWEPVKKAVNIPVFASGGNRSPEFAEKILREGVVDYVSLGRQLWADPEWPNKAKAGKTEDIRSCIACLTCFEFLTPRGASDSCCAINPALGREQEFGWLNPGEGRPSPAKKKVTIIGAGPGGLKAARVAALRGHDVTLYEKDKELGGQLRLSIVQESKKERYKPLLDYFENQLKKLDVKVKLGTKVTPDMIEKTKPDVLIVATGATQIIPEIPGVKDKKVAMAWDIFEGKKRVENQRVVIAGGGLVGAEVAEFLADRGNAVTIVEMLPKIAMDMEILNRRGLIDALKDKKVAMLTEYRVVGVEANGLSVENLKTREKDLIEADCIVLAMGARPATELADALEDKVHELYTVGDCREPRKIATAVYEGAIIASRI